MAEMVERNGYPFPSHKGEALSWSIGLYFTDNEAREDYPRLRAVVRAMLEHRPEHLRREYYDTWRSCSDRLFGHKAKRLLAVLESEMAAAQKESEVTS